MELDLSQREYKAAKIVTLPALSKCQNSAEFSTKLFALDYFWIMNINTTCVTRCNAILFDVRAAIGNCTCIFSQPSIS